MNTDTFAFLRQLKDNLEGRQDISLAAINEIKYQCQQALHLIDNLRFQNNSAHVQLATKQAIQYIEKALYEIDAFAAAYNPRTKSSTVNIKDISSPALAGLEIILNLNY